MQKKYILPMPRFKKISVGVFEFINPRIVAVDCDERVNNELTCIWNQFRDEEACEQGSIEVRHAQGTQERYDMLITPDGIRINAHSAAGAFYALQTLKQLLVQGRELSCGEIHDAPSMAYRGFYHDISRGRIPTLDTLKKLVDKLALYKINALQLYVEHPFAFPEYEKANEGQNPMTAQEIKELAAYCKDRFIDLQPSLSCFGHLYNLLETPEYKHLREIEEFTPARHLWWERHLHHTIDPCNPDSFALIKGLIDQYMPLFDSQYFNICCDETFDLGKGRNKELDAGRLYIDFVKKLVSYVESKGKIPMLWGDIVLNHIDLLPELSSNAVLLNWCYSSEPPYEQIVQFEKTGRRQIVCPGTSAWLRMVEYLPEATPNIKAMAAYAQICGCEGMLNTNWGDAGHFCDIPNAAYGMILGAAESWNVGAAEANYFDKAISVLNYQCDNDSALKAIKLLNDCDSVVVIDLCRQIYDYHVFGTAPFNKTPYVPEMIDWRIDCCNQVTDLLQNAIMDQESKEALILAAQGYQVLWRGIRLYYNKDYEDALWSNDFSAWCASFAQRWRVVNKKDELPILQDFLRAFASFVSH